MKKELNEKILPIYDDLLFLTSTLQPDVLKNYLENAQPYLFVYLNSDFSAENKQFLQNLITACKLNNDHIQYLGVDQNQDFNLLFPQLLAKKIVLFGISLKSDIFSTSYIQQHIFEFNGKQLLQTSSLEKLSNNKELKFELWNNGLKPLFDI